MLSVGGFAERCCEGITRRAFLRAGASLPLAWGLGGLGDATLFGATSRAKSILLVWLGGGPSHLDLFDPKPAAPVEFRGPFSTVATRTPGVRFTELLPKLAARSHRFSLVRTNVNHHGGHREAGSIGLTGIDRAVGDEDYPPNFGSILARHRPQGGLPSFISLARGPIGDGVGPVQGYGGGVWGKAYDPFMVSCSETGEVSIPSLNLLDGLSANRLGDRRLLLGEFDHLRRRVDSSNLLEWDHAFERAYSLLTSPKARAAVDLSREPAPTREAYGHTSFGQSCLLGRRLVEAGAAYVQVNWSQFVEVFYPFSDYGWDTHADNFTLLADWHGPLLDRVLSALVDDLHDRGLMDSTLLLCMGEFGRTPRINSIGSRDHWHPCYFSIWAGAGVEPGRVVGESDPHGEYPSTRPVSPLEVGTTILELAGMGTQARAELKVLEGGRVIHELL
jgi:hypothetical protein